MSWPSRGYVILIAGDGFNVVVCSPTGDVGLCGQQGGRGSDVQRLAYRTGSAWRWRRRYPCLLGDHALGDREGSAPGPRLRQTMPAAMNRDISAAAAAVMIADGFERRSRRIWVPGWVGAMHWMRAFLHAPFAERKLHRAARLAPVQALDP